MKFAEASLLLKPRKMVICTIESSPLEDDILRLFFGEEEPLRLESFIPEMYDGEADVFVYGEISLENRPMILYHLSRLRAFAKRLINFGISFDVSYAWKKDIISLFDYSICMDMESLRPLQRISDGQVQFLPHPAFAVSHDLFEESHNKEKDLGIILGVEILSLPFDLIISACFRLAKKYSISFFWHDPKCLPLVENLIKEYSSTFSNQEISCWRGRSTNCLFRFLQHRRNIISFDMIGTIFAMSSSCTICPVPFARRHRDIVSQIGGDFLYGILDDLGYPFDIPDLEKYLIKMEQSKEFHLANQQAFLALLAEQFDHFGPIHNTNISILTPSLIGFYTGTCSILANLFTPKFSPGGIPILELAMLFQQNVPWIGIMTSREFPDLSKMRSSFLFCCGIVVFNQEDHDYLLGYLGNAGVSTRIVILEDPRQTSSVETYSFETKRWKHLICPGSSSLREYILSSRLQYKKYIITNKIESDTRRNFLPDKVITFGGKNYIEVLCNGIIVIPFFSGKDKRNIFNENTRRLLADAVKHHVPLILPKLPYLQDIFKDYPFFYDKDPKECFLSFLKENRPYSLPLRVYHDGFIEDFYEAFRELE